MFRRTLLLLLPLCLALAGVTFAASPTTGDLTGVIRDGKNKPVPNVRVRFSGPQEGTVRTDGDGRYLAADLFPGDYEVFLQKPGYHTVHRGQVQIQPGRATEINLKLEWADPNLGALEVVAQNKANKEPLPETVVDLIQNGFPVAQSQTDESGTVVFPGLNPGVFRVQARRPGFVPLESGNLRLRNGQMTTAAVRLKRDASQVGGLAGVVRSLAGNPINGATVRLVRGLSRGQRTTSGGGQYQFTDLIPGDGYALEVDAPGFQSKVLGGVRVVLQQVTTQDVTLLPSAPSKGSISGIITDDAGEPLPLAVVRVTAGPDAGTEIEADGNGAYTLPDLTPGAHSIVASAAGFNPAGRSPVQVNAGQTSLIDLELSARTVPPGSLTGLVREQGSALLLSEVVVEVVVGPSAGLATETDVSGGYTLPGLIPHAGYTVRFRKDGYIPLSKPLIEVESGSASTLTVELRKLDITTGSIQGTVRRFGAGALADVKVTVFQGPTSPVITKTDNEGNFALRGLEAGLGYGLRLEKSGFVTLLQTNIHVNSGQVTRTGDLVMNRTADTGTLRVQVVDLLGRAIPQAGVTITEGPTRPPRGETDSSGRASFPGLLPGAYTVDVVANGFQNGRRALIGVQAGRTTDTNVQLLSAG